MNKRIIFMSMITMLMACFMTQSMMAKKIEYMGHQYDGKVNKEKIPEGKGTIKIDELSISGIFKGNVITNASFSTTWLSYKGDVVFYDNDNITLKDGGTIYLHIYDGNEKWSFIYDRIKFQEKKIEGDTTVDYQKLKKFLYQVTLPIEKLDERLNYLNPPTERAIMVLPEERTYLFRTGPAAPLREEKILIYSTPSNNKYRIEYEDLVEIHYYEGNRNGKPFATLDNYKDKEGGVWKRIKPTVVYNGYIPDYEITYPDGSFCSKQTDYKRIHPDKSYYFSDGKYRLILPNGIIIYGEDVDDVIKKGKAAPYRLDAFSKKSINAESYEAYVSGENKKIVLSDNASFRIFNGDGAPFEDYGRIKQIFNDSIRPYLETRDWEVSILRNSFIALTYKDGVVEINQDNEQQAAAAKEADFYRSIANFKKKYGFDPSVDNARYVVKVGRNILGVVDARNEWIETYHAVLDRYYYTGIIKVSLEIDRGSSKCWYFYYNGSYCGYFWTRNNIITSVTWR